VRVYYSLYGRLLSLRALYEAFKRVKKNKGAAGIDGQSVQDFEQNLEGNLKQLLFELQEKRYQSQPVKRVEIDKDDGGKRLHPRKEAENTKSKSEANHQAQWRKEFSRSTKGIESSAKRVCKLF
jgi:hypothetical protein